AMIDRQTYITQLEESIQRWQKEILKFKVIAEAEEAEPDAQIEYYQVIQEIAEKQETIKNRLNVLKNEGNTTWNEEIKEEIEALSTSLDEAIESARVTIN
ncbi:MAG: hypothetical protein IH612_21565, partial [Desulfofustis sp.]|nr:hypothetical protein [Desulfofustis sp.]